MFGDNGRHTRRAHVVGHIIEINQESFRDNGTGSSNSVVVAVANLRSNGRQCLRRVRCSNIHRVPSSSSTSLVRCNLMGIDDAWTCVHCYDHSLDEMCVVGDDGGGDAFRTD
ncbi:hypothetical protein BLOT_002957 [Blomia tropicalis]|nr:hypothetical protein BLOT_002957 [Blomia tropicalis]